MAFRHVVMFRFTDRLYRSRSAEEDYAAAIDAICAVMRCERASILLFDEAGVMRFVAWRGLSEAYRKAVDGHSPWTPEEVDPQPIERDQGLGVAPVLGELDHEWGGHRRPR